MDHFIYKRNLDKCWNCGFCTDTVACPNPESCIGCQSCYLACFREAIEPISRKPGPQIEIIVNNNRLIVPSKITVKAALEFLGFQFSQFPSSNALFAPCQTGGCNSCNVLVNGIPQASCHTEIQEGQHIQTDCLEDIEPRRIVGWYTPHPVGGVGTPWIAKDYAKTQQTYIEVACFTAGCNLRCKTCQNFDTTYNSKAPSVTPLEAATILTKVRHQFGVNRLAVSGGEPTLNRKWLLQFFTHLKQQNSDTKARLHLDTNASILTPDYIDELIRAGVTDIGPDLKAVTLQTYQTITNIKNPNLAQQYLDTSWQAVEYLSNHYYPEQIFVGVGLPFNPDFFPNEKIMIQELQEWGRRLAAINNRLQVCILDYRPTFRRRHIQRPLPDQVRWVKSLLENLGLKTVIAQTQSGHLPPLHPAPDRPV